LSSNISCRAGQIRKSLAFSAGDPVLLKKCFGKSLAGFDLGGSPGGTKDGNTYLLELVYYAFGQGSFRPNYNEIDPFFQSSFRDRLDIGRLNFQINGYFSGSGVTGRCKNLADSLTSGQFPDQNMLTSSISNN
jgi:hypothetical protein